MIGNYSVTFGAAESSRTASIDDIALARVHLAEARLEAKAQRLQQLVRQRDSYFRHSIMADGTMRVMLSLFQAELASIAMSSSRLALTTMLDEGDANRLVEALFHAGLVVITGENPERRAVGLTPLGSARIRSFVSDYPDI